MNQPTKHNVRSYPAFLTGPWPVVLLLACHYVSGLSAASRKSVTFDEITHLSSGYIYWAANDYRMDPESGNWPQRWAALPLWLKGYHFPSLDDPSWRTESQWNLADRFFHSSDNNADAMLLQGRAMIGLLSLVLGLLVYLWSRQLFGPIGGLISLTLFAFSPTMLSHGFLATADLSTALFFTATVWALWALVHRISWFTLAASCFALAGLFLSKFSGVLVVPMWVLLIIVRMCNPAPIVWSLGQPREINGRARQLLAFLGALLIQFAVVLFVFWASYGFRFAMVPETPQQVATPRWMQNASGGLGITQGFVQFALDHHLLPESYLYGFTYTMLTAAQREAFLNGEFSIHGWAHYFPYALLVKTPLEVFVVLILAIAALWKWRSEGRLYSLAPLLILLGVYWMFSLTSHLNIGHRHLLPTYPAMFILAGAAALWFQQSSTKKICAARMVLTASLILSAVEAVACWPNYLAYFNFLAGGPHGGYRHLVDSSLDWGQDLNGLKQWLDAHPSEAAHVYLAYFGTASPKYYGIDATMLPGFFNRLQPRVPEPLAAGTYCISATLVEGIYLQFPGKWNAVFEELYQDCRQKVLAYRKAVNNPDALKKLKAGATQQDVDKLFSFYEGLRLARLFSFLRAREPDFDVGHSILIYKLTEADVQQATDGPPVELLPDCEPDVKACLGIPK